MDTPQPRRRGRPRGSRNRFPSVRRSRMQPSPEPRALGSAIPAGPVVVSPAALAQRRLAATPATPSPAGPPPVVEGTLEALIREVEERRTAA